MRDLELWMLGPVDEFEQHVAADELDLVFRDRVDPIADNVPEHAEHEGCIPEKDLANTLPPGPAVPAEEDPQNGESGLVPAMHNALSGGHLPLHLVCGDVAGPHLLAPVHRLLQRSGRVDQVALPGAQEAAACRVVHSGREACAEGLQVFDVIVDGNLLENVRRDRLPLHVRFGNSMHDPRQHFKGQKEEQQDRPEYQAHFP
mmetsp:Transcript_2366/g.6746  ORF Transcript_2366/g.6746 Transcript_2366/m.6746 type:complete len:202 (+) Transcript_2366:323-928(+)